MDALKSAFKMVVGLLLGSDVKSSLVGFAMLVLTEGALYFDKLSGYGWHLVALGFVALGRVVADATKPALPPAP